MTSSPLCPSAVGRGKWGISAYGMRVGLLDGFSEGGEPGAEDDADRGGERIRSRQGSTDGRDGLVGLMRGTGQRIGKTGL